MRVRNSLATGYPEAEPITTSTPHFGQSAVRSPCGSSVHSLMADGSYVARQ